MSENRFDRASGGFAKVMWSPSYLAAPVRYVSESTVRGYIVHQWDAVIAS